MSKQEKASTYAGARGEFYRTRTYAEVRGDSYFVPTLEREEDFTELVVKRENGRAT